MFLHLFMLCCHTYSETDAEHKSIPIEALYKRRKVAHPCSIYNLHDIERAKRNSEANKAAKSRLTSLGGTAKSIMKTFNDEFIEKFVPITTPGTTTFCPNCEAKGYKWHANGNWAWNADDPDHLKCNVCGMVFPNAAYPESLKFKSKWDPRQTISYVNNGPVKCMGYKVCRSSMEGVIRGNKLQYFLSRVYYLALGYLGTNNVTYAYAVKKGLNKLAERIPKYMVYAGYSYSEYCDEDPHKIVKDPSKCKRFIYAPGNNKSEGLYNAYWAGSRLGSSGMDGSSIYKIALAYDLTVDAKDENGKSVYSESEKDYIAKNCVIEAALIGFYDTEINNKAVGNRKGVAIAGLATGSHLLARFGLDGFLQTIDDWFLPDGGTPESSAYAQMTIGGIYEFGLAFRDYSDPDDFVPPPGERKFKHFNVNRDTSYDEAWQALLWTSYGNYYFPPIADSYITTTLGNSYIDYLAMAYDTKTVKTYVQEKYDKINYISNEALFYRDLTQPLPNVTTNITYEFPDVVFPYLQQGYLRTGYQGRDSLIVLDASQFDNHHHTDSLNIVYWKDGRELLNDLGYLWDHVNASHTHYTKAHHTVIIDSEDQTTRNRNGSFHIFSVDGNAKVMQASSDAYKKKNATIYKRTIVQINHNISKKNYIVDIFRANGGERREYVFHGIHHNYTMNQKLNYNLAYKSKFYKGCVRFPISTKDYFDISKVILKEINYDQTMGPNMVKKLEPDAFAPGGPRCPENGTWCYYVGNGKHEIKVENKGPNGEQSIHFAAVEPQVTPSKEVYNVALNIGNSDGYRGPNGLVFDKNKEYYLEFYMKGSIKQLPSICIQYWPEGKEDDPGSRMYSGRLKEITNTIINDKWQKFAGKLSIGVVADKLGAAFTDDLTIKWDIDENYTFTSFTPKRNVEGTVVEQKIFYEDGWGQRDYKNTDFGVTLPYFYLCRDEENFSTFVNVYEGSYKGEEVVKGVSIIEQNNGSVAIMIDTKEGKDIVLSSFDGKEVSGFGYSTNAEVAVQIAQDIESSIENSTPMMVNGEYFKTPDREIEGRKSYSGDQITAYNQGGDSWFDIKGDFIDINRGNLLGATLFAKGECGNISDIERGYPIRRVGKVDSHTYRIYTKTDGVGFRTHCHTSWRIPFVANPATQVHNVALSKAESTLITFGVVSLILGVSALTACFVYCRNPEKHKKEEENTEEVVNITLV